jgi:hypothetical protein
LANFISFQAEALWKLIQIALHLVAITPAVSGVIAFFGAKQVIV